jgi:hypothetical protein
VSPPTLPIARTPPRAATPSHHSASQSIAALGEPRLRSSCLAHPPLSRGALAQDLAMLGPLLRWRQPRVWPLCGVNGAARVVRAAGHRVGRPPRVG